MTPIQFIICMIWILYAVVAMAAIYIVFAIPFLALWWLLKKIMGIR